MTFVLDASIAVTSVRSSEAGHAAAKAALKPLLEDEDQAVVPAIFRIEVASALIRSGSSPPTVEWLVSEFLRHTEEVTLGPKRAQKAQQVAIATKLRAADAIYVCLASARGLPLLTSDREIAKRAAGLCEVRVI